MLNLIPFLKSISADDVPDVRTELNKYRKINRNSGGGTAIYNSSYKSITLRQHNNFKLEGGSVTGVGGYKI